MTSTPSSIETSTLAMMRRLSSAWGKLSDRRREEVWQRMGTAGAPKGTSFDDVVSWWQGLVRQHPRLVAVSFAQRLLTLCTTSRKRNPLVDLPDDITEEDLDKLAKEGSDDEKRAVARHPNTRLETLSDLVEDFADDVDENPMLLLYLEQEPDEVMEIIHFIAEKTTRIERLRELAESSSLQTKSGVAWNRFCPVDLLETLSKYDHFMVRMMVASNPNTPVHTLRELSEDSQIRVRRSVAVNKKTPEELLEKMCKDPGKEVRSGVASNPKATPSVLRHLAEDVNTDVRYCVAENKNTTLDTLKFLSMDPEDDVRAVVANHHNATDELLEVLFHDESVDVRANAKDNLDLRTNLRYNNPLEMFSVHREASCPRWSDPVGQRVSAWFAAHGVKEIGGGTANREPDEEGCGAAAWDIDFEIDPAKKSQVLRDFRKDFSSEIANGLEIVPWKS